MSDQPEVPKGRAWWTLQATGWLFLAYLIYAQLIPVFDYQLGVEMGTQESAELVTDVGVAYWKAFAFGDLVTYAPLLLAGLIGHLLRRQWGRIALAAAFGITVYWPVVSLAAVHSARKAEGWMLGNPIEYWIVLPIITLWGLWGLWVLLTEE
ncbi:hypothetical protein MUY35_01000 [Aliiroseovarius sp. S1339]|uniref:hypothetical protein n=1 Tax=Aliiroseovarius sp. S1339 TaxID=2936990 RepID=UPI0020C0EC72|nr:hypothetical protein [Aliiroseovarius sp. S1339]MCK8462423.1 hypothetical protein [Aliiroseovarius sp. S1339]